MAPPAVDGPIGYYSGHKNDYSNRYDVFFDETWNKLLQPDIKGTEEKEKVKETAESNRLNYFDTGLNVEGILGRHCTPATPAKKEKRPLVKETKQPLPRFGLLAKLEKIFGQNLVDDNPYISQEANQRKYKNKKTIKRVRFSKVELLDKHYPTCRRHNYQKQEFGHLHSPSCPNYKSEKSLCKQEFLVRGNFIRSNTRVARSETEFYEQQVVYDPPVRQVEPLPGLGLPDQENLKIDLKSSTLDSITKHDRCSPGLRTNILPVLEPPRPMPLQPEFVDMIIEQPQSGSLIEPQSGSLSQPESASLPKSDAVPDITVQRAPINSQDSSDSEESVGSSVNSVDRLDVSDRKMKGSPDSSEIGSSDSGFVDDYLSNLSDDDDSESDDDQSFVPKSEISEEEETVCDGSSSTTSLSQTVEHSLSDSECEDDIDVLLAATHRRKKVVVMTPKSWVSTDSNTSTTEPSMRDSPQTASEPTEDCYINPLNKRKPDSTVKLKSGPSVLGKLICDNTTSITPAPVRNPRRSVTGVFQFDTPSPDDVVRTKQAGILPPQQRDHLMSAVC